MSKSTSEFVSKSVSESIPSIVPLEFSIIQEMHQYVLNEFTEQREFVEAWQKKFPKLETHVTEYLNKLKTQLGIGIQILQKPNTITNQQAVKLVSLWKCSRRTDVSGYFKKLDARERLAKISEARGRLLTSASLNFVPSSDLVTKVKEDEKESSSVNVSMSQVVAEIARLEQNHGWFDPLNFALLEDPASTEDKMVVEKPQLQSDQAQDDHLSFMVEILRRTRSMILNLRIGSGPIGTMVYKLIDELVNPFMQACDGAFILKGVIPNLSSQQKTMYSSLKRIYGNRCAGEVKELTGYRAVKDKAMVHDMLESKIGTFVANSSSYIPEQDGMFGFGMCFRDPKGVLECAPMDLKTGHILVAISKLLAPDNYICHSVQRVPRNENRISDVLDSSKPIYKSVVISTQPLENQDELKDTLCVLVIEGKVVTFSSDKIGNVDLNQTQLLAWQQFVEAEFKDVPLGVRTTIVEPDLIIKIQLIGPSSSIPITPILDNPETGKPFVIMSNESGSVVASNDPPACYAPLFLVGMFAPSSSSSSSSSSTASSSSLTADTIMSF